MQVKIDTPHRKDGITRVPKILVKHQFKAKWRPWRLVKWQQQAT